MRTGDIIKFLIRILLCVVLVIGQFLQVEWGLASNAQAVSQEQLEQDSKTLKTEKPLVQMVRNLQHIHDSVARGEKVARAKQARLLGDIGRSFASAPPETFSQADNLYALVTYLFNGGNPAYIETILDTIPSDVIESFLLDGALAYAKGDEAGLVGALGPVDLDELGWGVWPQDLRLSAYLALALHLAMDDPKAAQGRLAFVRTLAPGTLFEEAALRREVRLDVLLQDHFAIRRVIHSYASRFGSSPYASDFWREIRLALPMLESGFDDDTLASLTDMIPEKEQYMLYLRIARATLLEGRMQRTAFAATHALELARALKIKGQSVPARLYLAATLAATQQADEAIAMLGDISRQDLPNRDRPLFDAVSHIAHAVVVKQQKPTSVEIERIRSLVQTDEAPSPYTDPHADIVKFLTMTQETLNRIDMLLEQ